MTGSSCSVFTEVCSPVQKLKSLQYPHYSDDMENTPTLFPDSIIEVAEHSFQVPMLNSPLLLNYLYFGARFFARVKVNHRRVFSRILAGVCDVVMATELVKNKA